MLYTTFKLLHEAGACEEEYKLLAKNLGGIKIYGKEKPIPLTFILDMKPNGFSNILWSLPFCTEKDKATRISQIFACDCAEHVVYIYEKYKPNDKRPQNCIATARRFIDGNATKDELAAAGDAARDAARAGAAAGDAVRAGAAARDAARAAAWAAARDAARAAGDAARAAGAAARDAENKWQKERLLELLDHHQ